MKLDRVESCPSRDVLILHVGLVILQWYPCWVLQKSMFFTSSLLRCWIVDIVVHGTANVFHAVEICLNLSSYSNT